MGAVQFFGINNVVKAFEHREIEVWAIFEGKEFMAGGSGADELRTYLTMLSESNTTGTYRLKVYKGIDEDSVDDLTDKEPSNGSFKFKLSEAAAAGGVGRVGGPGFGGDIVMTQLHGVVSREVAKVLEKKFNGEGETEEKEETLTDVIMGLIKNPEKLAQVVGMVKTFFSSGAPAAMPVQFAAVGNVQRVGAPSNTAAMPEPTEEELQRLSAAITKLEKADPKILSHLEKLALMSEKNPALFNMIIGQLDAMTL